MNVVLAGNPNAGKTTLFNALTNSNLRTGNFHGVTTSPARKKVKSVTYSDVPGTYTFNPYSMEEQSAIDEIKSADLTINVIDALTLENSLNLTKRIISGNKRVIIYLTKTGALKKRGGWVDTQKLSAHLGVPVYDCAPKKLKKIIESGNYEKPEKRNIPLTEAYSGGNIKISKADRLLYNSFFALFVFVISIIFMFFIAFHPAMIGAYLKDITESFICDTLCKAITAHMSNPALISLLEEGIFGGAGSVISFLPQLAVLYLFLTVLDESGIMSALAFATDGLFEKVHLSGRAAFSLVSGFGCTAAAILTTRGYSTTDAQKRTIAVLPFVPCGAKLPVFLTFLTPLFENPFPAVCGLYFLGLGMSIIASAIIKGGGEGMLSEVTPVIFPSLKAVFFKLFFHLKGFIIKVAGIVTLFCVINWFLSHFSFSFVYVEPNGSILASFSKIIAPLFYPMGIKDWRLAYAALCGFIAKENVAATVLLLIPGGLSLSFGSALAMCVFMLFCPACVSALSASAKEAGLKFTLKCVIVQLLIAFTAAYAVNLIL